MRTKQWYVAHLVNMSSFNLFFFIIFTKKMRGSERGPDGGPEEGVQVLSTPSTPPLEYGAVDTLQRSFPKTLFF